MYFLAIFKAIDKGHPPKNSTTEVIITLLDINDNAPVFKKDEYEANVHENSEPQKVGNFLFLNFSNFSLYLFTLQLYK